MFDSLRTGPDRPTLVTDLPLDKTDEVWASGRLWKSLAPSYRLTSDLGWVTAALRPVTGNSFAPAFIYEPIGGASATARAHRASRAGRRTAEGAARAMTIDARAGP